VGACSLRLCQCTFGVLHAWAAKEQLVSAKNGGKNKEKDRSEKIERIDKIRRGWLESTQLTEIQGVPTHMFLNLSLQLLQRVHLALKFIECMLNEILPSSRQTVGIFSETSAKHGQLRDASQHLSMERLKVLLDSIDPCRGRRRHSSSIHFGWGREQEIKRLRDEKQKRIAFRNLIQERTQLDFNFFT
jgi:hypothetical protein